ncbi:hypothetical protein [Patulibacter sp. SYSU D01012]|uniref:hypothetical protein n=1 Tax=Patulibacter sp. SYSU D01012 TaxID=2817381 RepID=UPI001B301069|nr:hypothetical protein [Patulibacter sp. SYSU D01012]
MASLRSWLSRGVVLLGAGALATLPAAAAPTPAAAAGCGAVLSATLDTRDPTALLDAPVATVRRRGGRAVTGVRVTVSRGGRTYATGTARRLSGARTPVTLHVRRAPTAGTYRVRATGRAAGCGRVAATRRWAMDRPSLPVRATLRGQTTEGAATVVRVLLRSVAGRPTRGVRVKLVDGDGRTVASAAVGSLRTRTEVALRASGRLTAGTYRAVVSGTAGGRSARATSTQTLRLSASSAGPDAATPTPSRQRAVLDWSGGSSTGRDVVGAVLPGIGHAELLCRTDAQGLRVFPTDLRREVAMMTWTYKDWGGGREKALREALHAGNTGPDFTEGLNKFSPPEGTSTGEFIALVSDRGPIGSGAPTDLAAPVAVRVTWAWAFPGGTGSRCHVEATVLAATGDGVAPPPAAAQVVWRGDASAPGHDAAAVDVPGVGRLDLVCQAGPTGQRTVTLQAPGGTVVTREASTDAAVPYGAGPLVAQLPNNGQLELRTPAGASVLISSRWKVNDPDPVQNSCAVAALGVAG